MHDPGSSSKKYDKWLLVLIYNETSGGLYHLCGGQKGTVKNKNVEWHF